MTTKRTTTALLLALGLLAAGCGGGGGGGGGGDDDVASVSGDDGEEQAQGDAEEDEEAELIDWAECMRDQGIDIPDPTRDADGNLVLDGPGIHIGSGEVGIGTQSPQEDDEGDGDEPPISPEEMNAATEECGPPPALGGADMSEEDRAKMEADALEFAECMRDEGIGDFPDPDFSGEGPGGTPQTRRDGPEEGGGPGEGPQERIVLGPFGEIDLNDPQIKAAFEACQGVIGIPEGGPGGPGAPGAPAGGGSSET